MEEKETHQSEFPPEFGGEKKEGKKESKSHRRSTLRLRGSRGDYLPGVIDKKVNLRGVGKLREAMAKILGKDVTYQPELNGLERGEAETKEKGENE